MITSLVFNTTAPRARGHIPGESLTYLFKLVPEAEDAAVFRCTPTPVANV